MRILVTGAAGMLETDLCQVLRQQGYEVVATDIQNMDVRNHGQVRAVMDEVRPERVYHLAALTDVDACEREPEAAFQTNAVGTQIVALECLQIGAELVYVSTISVFDGAKAEPYIEFDQPNPQNWYARSKYAGEQFVQRLLPRAYICRAGWMFGGGAEDKKFVAKMLSLAREREELPVVDDKFGSPTYTVDVSEAMIRICETGLYGTYHVVNSGPACSRYEFAQAIFDLAGIHTCHLIPVRSAHFPLAAPRPRMEAARNLMLELHNLPPMRPWRAALRDYIERLTNDEGRTADVG